MTAVYVFHGDAVLLIRRVGSRLFRRPLWCGVGGHFEESELSAPEACALRELREETALTEADIRDLTLKYVLLRKKDGEIRQQYVYFAQLANPDAPITPCGEGALHWVKLADLFGLEMSVTNTQCLRHYFETGKNDGAVYVGATAAEDGQPRMVFTPLGDFDTTY